MLMVIETKMFHIAAMGEDTESIIRENWISTTSFLAECCQVILLKFFSSFCEAKELVFCRLDASVIY